MEVTWSELSKEISQAIEQAGRSIVAVDGQSGRTSSGIVWRDDAILTAAHTIGTSAQISIRVGERPVG